MILDLSNLIGRSVNKPKGQSIGNSIKFLSFGDSKKIDIFWYDNKKITDGVIINAVPINTVIPLYIRQSKTLIINLFTTTKIYIGEFRYSDNINVIQVGHLIYIKNGTKWVKQ